MTFFAFLPPLSLSPPCTPLPTCSQRSISSRTASARPPVRIMEPKATIAAPSDSPPSPSPSPTQDVSAPWMPLPSIVHSISTPEQFDRLQAVCVEQDALLVADFMASWCRKCLYLLPRLRKLGLQFPNVYLCSVDVNKVARLPKQFEITKMPTFIFFRGDRQVGTLIGGASPQNVATQLQSAVEKYAAQ